MAWDDAKNLNDRFAGMAKDYGYTGELIKFKSGTLVVWADMAENLIRLFEHRFDTELKLIKERLGVN